MKSTSEFLSRFPPFDQLDPEELGSVAESATVREFPRGTDVLVEDGPPAAFLYVIRRGAMALVHEGETIDVLATGECFGQTSLLTGLAPTFTVRAHEDSQCLLIPRGPALEVLGRPEGARYVAVSLRERLTRTEHVVHALPELRGAHVRSLVTRPPLFCDAETPIREVARSMTEQRQSAVLIRTRKGLGIVTDRDLRARVVVGDVSADAPVSMIMSSPVRTVAADQFAFEAMLEMLEGAVDHLAVVEPDGDVIGVVTAGRSGEPRGEKSVRAPASHRQRTERGRARRGLEAPPPALRPPARVGTLGAGHRARPCSPGRRFHDEADRHRRRTLRPAPAPWAWLALGSVARRELTLASDQDNALAYVGPGGAEIDAYFERLAVLVNGGLARCGFDADAAEVLARDRAWRMTDGDWRAEFQACLETPDRSHLVRAAVTFDLACRRRP